jgi:medium-chain acyl-[acyl-carrier-protein] hydrolase
MTSPGTGTGRSRTLVCLAPRPAPRHRLICVPYAGAGPAAYRRFPAMLPPEVETWAVRLPARESLIAEPPLEHIDPVVDALADQITPPDPPVPFALFGHSMGALVCFELARTLRHRGRPVPTHLFVSGRRGPRLPDPLPAIHRLPRSEFLAAVRRLSGVQDELLAEHGLIDLLVPALRADFAVCETYRYTDQPPLDCGISAFGGLSDPTTSSDQLAAWCRETTGPFRMSLFDGDHFFLHRHAPAILGAVARELAAPAGGGDA